jgi:quinoprotein glucose dehydrogenase
VKKHQAVLGTTALCAVLCSSACSRAPEEHAAPTQSAAPTAPASGSNAGPANVEWPYYAGNLAAQRYSPLDQINRDNVGKLEIAWRFQTGNYGPKPEARNEATPLMIGGVLYTTVGVTRNVVAIDPKSGETLWAYRPNDGEDRYKAAPRKTSGRGLSYWTDHAGNERLFLVTPGFYLVALDPSTGRQVPGFGENGVVDLMVGVRGEVTPKTSIGNSSPSLVIGDVVIVGPAHDVGMRPPAKVNLKGDVRGFDVHTGKLLWTFHTIPEKGELGYDTWLTPGSAEYTGNAGVWAPMAADPELGLVYLPVEGATSDLYGGERPGNNLFANSLVALDAKTGQRVWHQQLIHHDIWDYDNPTSPILLDVKVRGKPVKAIVQLTKQAFAYAFDRTTGAPLWPIVERPVPGSDVPGEVPSPTQPFPTKPKAYDRQGVTQADLVDFTPEIKAAALAAVKGLRMGPMFTTSSLIDAPDGTRGSLVLPHFGGGSNWEGGAADPETGIVYVASQTTINVFAVNAAGTRSDIRYLFVNGDAPHPLGLPLIKPPYGRITAIDMNTGEHRWMIPNGDTPDDIKNNPALAGVTLPPTGKPSKALLLVTKTLLFAAEGYGGAPILRAYDKSTGKVVAELPLPGVASGKPMSYMIGGKQYIVLAVGKDHPAELVALTLP